MRKNQIIKSSNHLSTEKLKFLYFGLLYFIQSKTFTGMFVRYFQMMALKMACNSELETDLSQVCNSNINFRRATTSTMKYFEVMELFEKVLGKSKQNLKS